MRITLRQLEILVAVARSGSTVGASQVVALSQSATSGAIIELERALDTRLFDRVGKRLLLNEQGRELLPQALALVDGAQQMEQRHADVAAGYAVGLRLAASTTIGNYVLPKMLAAYRTSLGAMGDAAIGRSRVLIANTADVAAAVAGFDVDVGLIEGPCREPDLRVVPWLMDELVIVAAPNHPIAANRSARGVSKGALRKAQWLLREPGSGTREAVEQALLPHLDLLDPGIEFGNSEAIKRAAAEGLGLTCLSRWVVADLLESRRLVELKAPWAKIRRRFYIVTHKRKRTSPGLQHFLDYCLSGRNKNA